MKIQKLIIGSLTEKSRRDGTLLTVGLNLRNEARYTLKKSRRDDTLLT